VTFSSRYATDLGLDWKAAYIATLDDLRPKTADPVYWISWKNLTVLIFLRRGLAARGGEEAERGRNSLDRAEVHGAGVSYTGLGERTGA